MVLFILTACSNEESKLLGTYKIKNSDSDKIVTIKEAGKEGYMIIFSYYDLSGSESYYCTFNDGCFFSNEDKNPIICTNSDNKLISKTGEIFTKIKKL